MIDKHDLIYVAGGSSMLGRATIANLTKRGYTNLVYPTHQECDWLVYAKGYDSLSKYQPKYILNYLGFNGGINFNKKRPADIFIQSSTLGLNILEAGSYFASKIVSVLPSCAYSFDKPYLDVRIPRDILEEKDFEDGQPHPSVACHGNSKRVLFDYSRVLNQQYGLNAVCCVLNNCFGPGARYNEPDRLKVADSLVRRFVLAKRDNLPSVTLWGTGNPKRELMYCEDSADGIAFVFENYNDVNEVINIGPGEEVSIKELAWMIKDLTGYEGNILWDVKAGDGQMRKLLDCSKIELMGWKPRWNLTTALQETIRWYEDKLDFENGSNAL